MIAAITSGQVVELSQYEENKLNRGVANEKNEFER